MVLSSIWPTSLLSSSLSAYRPDGNEALRKSRMMKPFIAHRLRFAVLRCDISCRRPKDGIDTSFYHTR